MIIMKKLIPLIFLMLFGFIASAQNISTLIKLSDISNALGMVNNFASDTVLVKAINAKMKKKAAEQQLFLLRAAEYYKTNDYESAIFYIKKVKDFDFIDLNNLKYVILVGSYANRKDINNTAKTFYDALKKVDPVNLRLIRAEIKPNFKKKDFDKAFSVYSITTSIREKIIADINFDE
jgi:hypothetical protein